MVLIENGPPATGQRRKQELRQAKALDSVSIAKPKGKITFVIGPNGSGKTTLANVISGFINADEGRILFKDQDITNKPPYEICRLGLIRTFQIPQPLRKLTVLDNLLIAKRGLGEGVYNSLRGRWVEEEEEFVEEAFEVLEFLELEQWWHRRAEELSGGQLKLLEVGRALMLKAELIIMDEPTAGVAPHPSRKILEKFRELAGLGISFLIVEHRLETVAEYADYVYAMANGRVIAEGSSDEVLANPAVVDAYLGRL